MKGKLNIVLAGVWHTFSGVFSVPLE